MMQQVVSALKNNKLPTDLTFSLTHPEEKIRDNAKKKVAESISSLVEAGISKPIVFYHIMTTFTMLYATNKVQLIECYPLLNECLSKIYQDDEYRRELIKQLMVQMHVVKPQSEVTDNILPAIGNYIDNMTQQS
jgi:hypothetical protein